MQRRVTPSQLATNGFGLIIAFGDHWTYREYSQQKMSPHALAFITAQNSQEYRNNCEWDKALEAIGKRLERFAVQLNLNFRPTNSVPRKRHY